MIQSQSTSINTEYNSNGYRIISLNDLLDQAVHYSRKAIKRKNIETLGMWKTTLIAIYDEVEPKMSSSEKNKASIFFDNLKTAGKLSEIRNTPMGAYTTVNLRNFSKYWSALNKIGRYLRHIADRKGLLLLNKSIEDEIAEMN